MAPAVAFQWGPVPSSFPGSWYLAPLACLGLVALTPLWVVVAKRNPPLARILTFGWVPIVLAMLISRWVPLPCPQEPPGRGWPQGLGEAALPTAARGPGRAEPGGQRGRGLHFERGRWWGQQDQCPGDPEALRWDPGPPAPGLPWRPLSCLGRGQPCPF